MRQGRCGGLCGLCGEESDEGLYWENCPRVLDFGVPGMAPIEPNMVSPVRCDSCETFWTVMEAYRDDPVWAQRIYCARSTVDALRLMDWKYTDRLRAVLDRERARREKANV